MRAPIQPPQIAFSPTAPRPNAARPLAPGVRVWLVRHALVDARFENTAYGDSDVPLSEEGLRQTAQMGEHFASIPLVRVVASNLARARAMGESLARASGAPLTIEPRLKEVSRGAWQGLPTAEFRARWEADGTSFANDPWNWKGHGGESDADLFARGWPALVAAVGELEQGSIALASHYNLIRSLVSGALGWSAQESFAFRCPPAHACLLESTRDGWKLLAAGVEDPRPFARG